MIHKDIRITFEVEGRRYEAVGFLNEGELSVDGDTMLSRTAGGKNGGAIGEEDEVFLSERRIKFPKELRKYYLATGGRDPVHPRGVSFFDWYFGRWCQHWGYLGGLWYGDALVLRRCA